MSNETVTITDNSTGKEVTLPLYSPTAGPKVIDIGTLYKELGYFTYDPGFMSTASCSSAITFLDGDKGVLADIDYAEHLWREKQLITVANVTAHDIKTCLDIAAHAGIKPDVTTYQLTEANEALLALRNSQVRGAKVLVMA